MISEYLSALANHLWQSTLFAAAVALIMLSLRHNRAAVRSWLWTAASVKFLVPFALLISAGNQFQSRAASSTSRPPMVSVVRNISVPFDAALSMPITNSARTTVRTSPAPAILFWLWLAGCIVVLFAWIREWHRLSRIIKAAAPAGLNIPVIPIRTLSTAERVEPGVVGILRPILLLPEGITERLTEKQFEAILAHELCHVRRRDNLLALLHMIVETIFWFHPLVWWIERRMIEERERACDEEVLRLTGDPQAYAEGILNVCRQYVEAPVICMSGVGGASLRKRIEGIMVHPLTRNLNLRKKLLLAFAAVVTIGLPVGLGILNPSPSEAQSAPRKPFEVASIKKNVSGGGASFGAVPGGRLIATNNPAANFIGNAYDVQRYQVVGAPDWIRTDRYDIEAKTDANTTIAQMMPMLQMLLEDRFKLQVHRETREMPVFVLTLAKGGIKVPPSTTVCTTFNPNAPPPAPPADGKPVRWCNNLTSGGRGGNMRWSAQNVGMEGIVDVLSSVLGRRVIDMTGFTGRIDVDVVFSTDPAPGDDVPPVLTTVLQDQLGLKLDSGRGPVEVLVIDHIERPSEN